MNIIGNIKSAAAAIAVIGLVAFGINVAASPEKDAQDARCSGLADAAGAALDARNSGVSMDAAMDVLRKQQIYSGPQVWAVKQAYKAPAGTSSWILKGSVMGECRKGAM